MDGWLVGTLVIGVGGLIVGALAVEWEWLVARRPRRRPLYMDGWDR